MHERCHRHLHQLLLAAHGHAVDLLEAGARIVDLGHQRHHETGHGVAALAIRPRQAHRHGGQQGFFRQRALLQQVAADGAAADRQQHVVGRGAGGLADRLDAFEVEDLRAQAALLGDRLVEQAARGHQGAARAAVRATRHLGDDAHHFLEAARLLGRGAHRLLEPLPGILRLGGPAVRPGGQHPGAGGTHVPGVGREPLLHHLHRAHAVDGAMVRLEVQRKAVALEAFDEVAFP